MDSLTCGLCKLTFHKLEEFVNHKQSHDCQNLPRSASFHPDMETELESETSCKVKLPFSCSSASQFGSTAALPPTLVVSIPSLSLAPNNCDTSSSVSLSNPSVNSPAPSLFSMYLASSSQVRASVIDATEPHRSFTEALERPLSIPDAGVPNPACSIPDTSRSDISSTSFMGPSQYYPLVAPSGAKSTKLIDSKFDRKVSIPASVSLQSYSSPISSVSIFSSYSLQQGCNNDARKCDKQSKLNFDDIQQNASENEVRDIILIELSETEEKNCELVAKVDVSPHVLPVCTAGGTDIGTDFLAGPQYEFEKEAASRLQSNEREVTCLISELNGQDYNTAEDCLPEYCTNSSITVPSDLSVIIDGVREQPDETSIPDPCVQQKSEADVAGGKTEGKGYSSSNYSCVYATAEHLSRTSTAADINTLMYENSDHCSSMENIVNTDVNITNEFNAEKVYFSQGSSIITTMYINNDSKFENKLTGPPSQNEYDKSVSAINRIVSSENEASVVSLSDVMSGSSDCYGTRALSSNNNSTVARLGDSTASGIATLTPVRTSGENFTTGHDKMASETNNEIAAEFDRTVIRIVPQIVSQANNESGALCPEENSKGKDVTLTKTCDVITSGSSNNINGNSANWTDSGNQTEIAAIVSNESGSTGHNEDLTSEAGVHAGPQSVSETTLLNGEEIDFVTTSELGPGSNDMADLTYASAPGLYTLLLNADNTFTLVAGGYQGSSAAQGSQVFVCRQCKKFALSQVEILNHISTCHPEDLDNVNQSVWEFSALPSSYSENSDMLHDTDPVFRHGITLNMEMTSRGSGNCLAVEGSGGSHLSPGNGSDKLSANKRTGKRKVGRPRKEDMVSCQDQNKELEKEKKFKLEGNVIVCLDCRKTFLKQRQFDKHKCCMWQVSLEQLCHMGMESFSVPPVAEGKVQEPFIRGDSHEDTNFDFCQENLFEEDLEEEWKGSKYYKPRAKPKPNEGERRKRGRPPKVDSLSYSARSIDDHSEHTRQSEGQGADDTMYKSEELNLLQDPKPASKSDTSPSVVSSKGACTDLTVLPRASSQSLLLNAIPTLPLFSNPRQQERLHKWIAQIDLSFVDSIIDKVCPDRGVPEKRGMAMYLCRECKVLFRTLLSCRRHCAKHMSKKAFTCPDCDFATTNVGALYSHYRNHTQNLYACDKCNFRARIKAHYRDHMETHNPSRHVCQLCQRPYSTSNSLKSHIYLSHRNEEGMNYIWCLRRKKQEQNKQSHVYRCPICSKLFSERLLANKHMVSHSSKVTKEVAKCEVCDTQPLHHGTLKRHMQKHKVVYICSVCCKPQLTASCLRSHLKEEFCNTYQGDTFKLSLLCSYTSPETFPSLVSNKRHGIGPLLQDLIKHLGDYKTPNTSVHSNLIRQIQEAGYKQIYDLLQELSKDANLKTTSKVMKIVVNTRLPAENEQPVLSKQHQQPPQQLQSHHHQVDKELKNSQKSNHSAEHFLSPCFPVDQKQQDLTMEETDQRVVVISNVGEEQTVVVEEGHMVLMDEERFVIIHEENEARQPSKLARFLAQAS